MNYNSKLRSIH